MNKSGRKRGIEFYTLLILLLAIIFWGSVSASTSTYDYNSGEGTSHFIYEMANEGNFPPLWTDGWGGSQISSYTNVQSDNGAYISPPTPGGNNYKPALRFNFTIAETPADINWIYVHINGYSNYDGGEDADCYIADFVTAGGTWQTICDLPLTDGNCNNNLTANIPNYIDGDQLVYLCIGKNLDAVDNIFIDYINVTVDYTVTADNPPYYDTTKLGVNDTTPNPGDTVKFYSWWSDDNGLSTYTLEWNETGSWVNQTWTSSPGNNTWHNYSIQVPTSDEGKFISGRIWANDSASNQFNVTTIVNITVNNVAPSVSTTSVNDTNLPPNEQICINATATDVGVGLDDVWAMVTYPNGTEINVTMTDTGSGCGGGADDWYGVDFNVGSTTGTLYVNTSYANDTVSNLGYENPFPNIAVTVQSVSLSFTMAYPSTGCTQGKGSADPGVTCERCWFEPTSSEYTINNGKMNASQINCEGQNDSAPTFPFYNFTNTGSVALNWTMKLNDSIDTNFFRHKVSQIANGYFAACSNDPTTNCSYVETTSEVKIAWNIGTSSSQSAWAWTDFINVIPSNSTGRNVTHTSTAYS